MRSPGRGDLLRWQPGRCAGFDTPTLRGVASSPPYFHDGSAPTLHDALEMTKGKMGDITSLSDMESTRSSSTCARSEDA